MLSINHCENCGQPTAGDVLFANDGECNRCARTREETVCDAIELAPPKSWPHVQPPFEHLTENELLGATAANARLRGLMDHATMTRLDRRSRAVIARCRGELRTIAEDLDAEATRRRRLLAEREVLEAAARSTP